MSGTPPSGLAKRPAASRSDGAGKSPKASSLLKLYSDDSAGLKVGPTTVLVLSLVFMATVVFLHIMAKFRSTRA